MSTTYDGPPCPHCGVATDDEGEKGQIGTFLAVCMNLDCHYFGRYAEVRRILRPCCPDCKGHSVSEPDEADGMRDCYDCGAAWNFRYALKQVTVPWRVWGIWDLEEDTWYAPTELTYDNAHYGAGVPSWRKQKDAQTVLDQLNGVS